MINQKLLAARKEKGWSIAVASARSEVSRVTYSRWENGHQEPQPKVLDLLCTAFGKSADDLGYSHLSKESTQSEAKERHIPGSSQHLYMLTEDQLTAFTTLLK